MKFDPNQPYHQYGGTERPGGVPLSALYTQNGQCFASNGRHIGAVGQSQPEESKPANPEEDNRLVGLHWKTLKMMVEDRGGEYTDKQSAIEFLSE